MCLPVACLTVHVLSGTYDLELFTVAKLVCDHRKSIDLHYWGLTEHIKRKIKKRIMKYLKTHHQDCETEDVDLGALRNT